MNSVRVWNEIQDARKAHKRGDKVGTLASVDDASLWLVKTYVEKRGKKLPGFKIMDIGWETKTVSCGYKTAMIRKFLEKLWGVQ